MALPLRLWRARWGVLRWCIAGFLVWAVAADTGARLARMELARMPDFDAAAEVARLRGAGQYGEAVVMADGALKNAAPERREAIQRELKQTIREQASWYRRIKDVGIGAATGGAGIDPGQMSKEMLLGAIATDMLVVGDVRDLAIQGWRYARGEETDPVIVTLSAIGIALTLAPEIDWAPSVLKVARKIGTLGEKLGEFIVRAARGRKFGEIEKLLTDSAEIARESSPGSAARLLRFAESPEDVARLSRFIGREGKAGAAALEVTGQSGATALRAAEELRAAGRAEEAALLESLVVRAAGKGEGGASWLSRGRYLALLRPHPIVGLLKSIHKGHASALAQGALDALGPHAWWVVPLLVGWFGLESVLLARAVLSQVGRKTTTIPNPQ